jgi:hypothetical protein
MTACPDCRRGRDGRDRCESAFSQVSQQWFSSLRSSPQCTLLLAQASQ